MKIVNLTNPSLPRIKAMFETQREPSGWFKPTRALLDFVNLPLVEMEQELRVWVQNHPAFGKVSDKPPMPKFEFVGYSGLFGKDNFTIACARSGDHWKDKYAIITWKGKEHTTHWSTLPHRLVQLGINIEQASFWRNGIDSVIKIKKPEPHKGPRGNRLS